MIYMFLSNNTSSGDINSSNLSCINLHLQIVYLQLHLSVFAFLGGGQLLPAAELFCDYS